MVRSGTQPRSVPRHRSEEARTIATAKGWVTEKANGKFLSRWRDERGQERSKQFGTRDEAQAHAESMAATPLSRVITAGPDFDEMLRGVRLDEKQKRWVWPDGTPWSPSGTSKALDPEFEFATYLRRMIERDPSLRPSTKELYLRNVRVHIEGTTLAEADIRAVTSKMVEDYWASLDIGVGALRNTYQLLAKAFNRAVVKGDIDVSPLRRAPEVKRPASGRREEVEPLTVDEVERLADGAKSPRDRLEVLVMAYGGLRAGEVGGLRKQDIKFRFDAKADCERAHLDVQQQVARVTGAGQYTDKPKSKAGRRPVTLACSVSAELKAFMESEAPAPDGRIFHGKNGAMRAHNAVLHNVKTASKRAGLPPVNSHRLRHTAVSFLVEDGANPKDIQKFVGHSSIKMTMDVYGHLFDQEGKGLADLMEKRRAAHRNGRQS